MGTPKIITISNWDASNVQLTTWQTNATKKKSEWCPMCSLWQKSSCELQGMYGLQGPTKENILTSPFETIHSFCTNKTNLTHSTRSNICSNN
jgi:hypothetical protein